MKKCYMLKDDKIITVKNNYCISLQIQSNTYQIHDTFTEIEQIALQLKETERTPGNQRNHEQKNGAR